MLTNVPRIRDVEVLLDLLAASARRSRARARRRSASRARRSRPIGRIRCWSGSCAARCCCSGRCWRGAARPASRRPGGDFPARRTIATHLQALMALGRGAARRAGARARRAERAERRVVLSRRGIGHRHRDGAAGRGRAATGRPRSVTPRWSRTSSSCASSCGRWASGSRATARRRSGSRRRPRIGGATHRLDGDYIEAGSWGVVAAITGGSIEVTGARWTDMEVDRRAAEADGPARAT